MQNRISEKKHKKLTEKEIKQKESDILSARSGGYKPSDVVDFLLFSLRYEEPSLQSELMLSAYKDGQLKPEVVKVFYETELTFGDLLRLEALFKGTELVQKGINQTFDDFLDATNLKDEFYMLKNKAAQEREQAYAEEQISANKGIAQQPTKSAPSKTSFLSPSNTNESQQKKKVLPGAQPTPFTQAKQK